MVSLVPQTNIWGEVPFGGIAKSVTRTLRLEEDLDRAIVKRASSDRVSVNFLVSTSLRKLVDWDIPVVEFGMVVVPDLLLAKFSSDKDEATFERFGRELTREFTDPVVTYAIGEFTVASCIEFFRRVALYSGRFKFDFVEGRDSRSYVMIIKHDRGRAWSRYYLGVLDEVFNVLLGQEAKIAYTDSLCICQLKVPQPENLVAGRVAPSRSSVT